MSDTENIDVFSDENVESHTSMGDDQINTTCHDIVQYYIFYTTQLYTYY